jgi:hypothetical protein
VIAAGISGRSALPSAIGPIEATGPADGACSRAGGTVRLAVVVTAAGVERRAFARARRAGVGLARVVAGAADRRAGVLGATSEALVEGVVDVEPDDVEPDSGEGAGFAGAACDGVAGVATAGGGVDDGRLGRAPGGASGAGWLLIGARSGSTACAVAANPPRIRRQTSIRPPGPVIVIVARLRQFILLT